MLAVVGIQLVAGHAAGLYTGRWRVGSFEEATTLALVLCGTDAALVTFDALLRTPLPLTAAVSAVPLGLVLVVALRVAVRLHARHGRQAPHEDAVRVIVFGAGDGGASIIAAMLRSPGSSYRPVALLDDDPTRRQLRLHGVSVRGDRTDIARVARRTKADTLLVAIPSASADIIQDLHDRAAAADLRFRVLPTVSELFVGVVGVGDIRPVSYTDLLGRQEADLDIEAIAKYATGKRVLVTGSGGSIGSELCRQLHRFAPASLVMLDRDESALHAVQLSIDGRALLDSRDVVVADIRDRQRIAAIFAEHRPEVVFHAAALKHLPLLEMHPDEAVKTNVWGTWNVLEAAVAAGVETFVNISTDKAADPCSMLGYSKRIAERMTAWFAARSDGTFLSVRFGNVLGSRGSVLMAFKAQIALGGPVTVTDPEVTRYFMTIEEAVRLVIQAGAVGRPGEALVLDMGEPVKIADVAARMVADSGHDIDIVYTGLRPGEKLHEVLLAEGEPDERPVYDQISHVAVSPLAPDDVRRLDPRLGRDHLVSLSRDMAAAAALPTGEPARRPTVLSLNRSLRWRRRATDPPSQGQAQ
jgi:FlaA1/EpsC-like NDP-sugar epimerase